MINVADRADINMWFVTLKLFLSHFSYPLLVSGKISLKS